MPTWVGDTDPKFDPVRLGPPSTARPCLQRCVAALFGPPWCGPLVSSPFQYAHMPSIFVVPALELAIQRFFVDLTLLATEHLRLVSDWHLGHSHASC